MITFFDDFSIFSSIELETLFSSSSIKLGLLFSDKLIISSSKTNGEVKLPDSDSMFSKTSLNRYQSYVYYIYI